MSRRETAPSSGGHYPACVRSYCNARAPPMDGSGPLHGTGRVAARPPGKELIGRDYAATAWNCFLVCKVLMPADPPCVKPCPGLKHIENPSLAFRPKQESLLTCLPD